MKAHELIACIERTAIPEIAAPWDKSGIQVAGRREQVTRLAVSLDPLPETIQQALDWNADFILTHHPLTLSPELPSRIDAYHRVLSMTLANGVWLYAAHTSLDAQPRGPAAWLAAVLELQEVQVLEPVHREAAVKMTFRMDPGQNFPVTAVQDIPGVIQVRQDAPRSKEVLCWPQAVTPVQDACGPSGRNLEVIGLLQPERLFGFGLIGDLPRPLGWDRFQGLLADCLGSDSWRCSGVVPQRVTRLGYCPGSGASIARAAFSRGAQVFVTGDVKYHQAQDAFGHGFVIDPGHFVLEEAMMRTWAGTLSKELTPAGCQVRFLEGRNPFQATGGSFSGPADTQ